MKIAITKASRDLIVEALEMYIDAYAAEAKDALDDGDDDAFHTFAQKELAAKTVLKLVREAKP